MHVRSFRPIRHPKTSPPWLSTTRDGGPPRLDTLSSSLLEISDELVDIAAPPVEHRPDLGALGQKHVDAFDVQIEKQRATAPVRHQEGDLERGFSPEMGNAAHFVPPLDPLDAGHFKTSAYELAKTLAVFARHVALESIRVGPFLRGTRPATVIAQRIGCDIGGIAITRKDLLEIAIHRALALSRGNNVVDFAHQVINKARGLAFGQGARG